jgi:hypothetical protein
MLSEIFTIYDRKVGAYQAPILMENKEAFVEAIKLTFELEPEAKQNVEDYAVYHLGTYDTETGKFDTQMPVHVINCIQLLPKETNDE